MPKPTHPEITAQHVGKGTLVVGFEPLPLFSGHNISYQLYFREVPPDSSPAVIENNACAQKRNGSSCIMWTACGLQTVGIAGPGGSTGSVSLGLQWDGEWDVARSQGSESDDFNLCYDLLLSLP